MKRTLLLVSFLCLLWPMSSAAEEFLGAPIPPDAKILQKTKKRVEFTIPRNHEDAVGFYKEALKDAQDIKFRNWKDATYIEDDGRLRWHSITISKGGGEESTILIVKDSWTWILGTLILRYVGVFAVLIVLFLGMSFSGKLIHKLVGKGKETAKAKA
jgi:hypothetical protein